MTSNLGRHVRFACGVQLVGAFVLRLGGTDALRPGAGEVTKVQS